MNCWMKVTAPQVRKSNSNFKWVTGLSLVVLVLMAGVVSFDSSPEKKDAPFDPRIVNAPTDAISPLDPIYPGYIPQDAVIPTSNGFYCPNDDAEGFKKLRLEK